jgi:hypothetical protein
VIENDLQRQRTLALMEGFRKAVAKLANDGRGNALSSNHRHANCLTHKCFEAKVPYKSAAKHATCSTNMHEEFPRIAPLATTELLVNSDGLTVRVNS